MSSDRYCGCCIVSALSVISAILYSIRYRTGSQCRSASTGVCDLVGVCWLQVWPAYSADAVTHQCSQTRYRTVLRYNNRASQQPWRRLLTLQQHMVAASVCDVELWCGSVPTCRCVVARVSVLVLDLYVLLLALEYRVLNREIPAMKLSWLAVRSIHSRPHCAIVHMTCSQRHDARTACFCQEINANNATNSTQLSFIHRSLLITPDHTSLRSSDFCSTSVQVCEDEPASMQFSAYSA